MRLIGILDQVNQIEKISFLKILDNICTDIREEKPQIDKILSEGDDKLKNIDNISLVNLFQLLSSKYSDYINERIKFSDYQLDILVDILIRDGNSIMTREWFSELYNNEITKLKKNIKSFSNKMEYDNNDLDPSRKRDYVIFKECVKTAYENDLIRNRQENISWEEKSILLTLANKLELSNEEIRWITYTVVPFSDFKIDDIIAELKDAGIIFFHRRNNTLYLPDEVLRMLRRINGIEIPNKYVRRILRNLTSAEINAVAKKHNVSRNRKREEKIHDILDQGVSVSNLLQQGIFKLNTTKSEKNKRIHKLIVNDLQLNIEKIGRSLEDKIQKIIDYYNEMEIDQSASISKDGFNRLLFDLGDHFSKLNELVKNEFQLQDEFVLSSEVLGNYNIQPRDVLYILTKDEIKSFCRHNKISVRGNIVANVIKNYRNIDDLLLENFDLVGNRDYVSLREKGISVKESELGLLYEKLTKKILVDLGFDVDEKLREELNTKRLKIDAILNLGNKNLIVIECKTTKEKDYNKYASVSRQLKSYEDRCRNKGFNVSQIILVANSFSDDFISDCEYHYELNLSLLMSKGLVKILNAFNECPLDEFPVKLFMKGGLLDENRIINVLKK